MNPLRETVYNVLQTIYHDCGEIFLGPDSLDVIRAQEALAKHPGRKRKISNIVHV